MELQRFFPGDFCYAIFADDGLWYEARVLKSDGKRGATVEFIGYGNVQECQGDQLKSKLKEEGGSKSSEPSLQHTSAALDFEFGLDGVLDAVEAIDLTDVATAARPDLNDIDVEALDK